jgi:predicted dehydrogenase
MSAVPTVRVGVIGAGLMGREVASAFGRWFALLDCPVRPELTAVCDVNAAALDWFRQVPTVRHLETDARALLARPDIDVVYVAVPHDRHEALYLDVLRAGKDLLAEKPFGIDLGAARRIRDEAARLGRFVRVSSEFPFLPGAQRAFSLASSGALGRILEVRAAFLHSSDLDPSKPASWKRQAATCGEAGVMNDLGMHVAHVPLRLGYRPVRVHAQLQKIHGRRPDGRGGEAVCDTWDNAQLHTTAVIGVRYSTKEPKTLWTYRRGKEQSWDRTDLGFDMPFRAITGSIFEPGFPDLLMQMWASFLAERAGRLEGRFGCATPDEAVAQHEIWAAALRSQAAQSVESP